MASVLLASHQLGGNRFDQTKSQGTCSWVLPECVHRQDGHDFLLYGGLVPAKPIPNRFLSSNANYQSRNQPQTGCQPQLEGRTRPRGRDPRASSFKSSSSSSAD